MAVGKSPTAKNLTTFFQFAMVKCRVKDFHVLKEYSGIHADASLVTVYF